MEAESFIIHNDKSDGELSVEKPYIESEDGDTTRLLKKATIKKKSNTKSLALVNTAAGLQGCDDQLFPSSFRALELDLNFYPAVLGQIALVQTIGLSLFCPVWGYFSDRHSKKWMLVIGCFSWGLITICLSAASSLWHVMLLRAFNGIALGSVWPISQGIIADVSKTRSRGFSFGLVQFSGCMGRLVGGIVTTSVSMLQVGQIRGWRICFFGVGVASILLSIVIGIFLEDFPVDKSVQTSFKKKTSAADTGGTGGTAELSSETTNSASFTGFVNELYLDLLQTPSILIIFFEAIVGIVPWSALTFNTMFFQYCNLSDVRAAFVTGALLFGAAVGGAMGGYLGDELHNWNSTYGRPLLGQISMLGRIPFLLVGYLFVPKVESSFWYFLFIAFALGLFSLAGVAVNRPVMVDVVRPQFRATVFSLVTSFEGMYAAMFGAPMVGYLSENVFGYEKTSHMVHTMSETVRTKNAIALANSIAILTIGPWSISFLLYGLLYLTYGNDQRKSKFVRRTNSATKSDTNLVSDGTIFS